MWNAPEPDCWLHPDVEVRPSGIAGEGLFARAPIPAGTAVSRLGGRLVADEELRELFARPDRPYIDTGTSTGTADFVMACGCGSARCRRIVTGDDWRLPDLQHRYGNHWVPALLTRIQRSQPINSSGLTRADQE